MKKYQKFDMKGANVTNKEKERLAKHLLERGYVVVKRVTNHRNSSVSFDDYLQSIPELKSPLTKECDKGIGGFGALNYASAFHHPHRIESDLDILDTVKPILEELARLLGLEWLQQIPDRSIYRTQSQSGTSWHTDNTSGAKENDIFFGAHFNLNKKSANWSGVQTFTCAPGHHSIHPRLKGGEYTPSDKDKIRDFKQVATRVSINPGEIMLHFENIPHLAGSKVSAENPVKKKIGAFRLSNHSSEWMPENRERLEHQAPLIYKGGEDPPMFAKMHLVNWPSKLSDYANLLIDDCVEDYKYQTGKNAGMTFTFPKRRSPSLASIGKKYKYNPVLEALNRTMYRVKRISDV